MECPKCKGKGITWTLAESVFVVLRALFFLVLGLLFKRTRKNRWKKGICKCCGGRGKI